MRKKFSPTLLELKKEIASAVATQAKAYNLVETCTSLGLEGGEETEAWASKFKYVEHRLANLDRDATIRLSNRILEKWDLFRLRESTRRFLCNDQPTITIITRQRLRESLAIGPPLSGRMRTVEFLALLLPISDLPSLDLRFDAFFDEILQHTERNDDWGNEELLDRLELMDASDEFLCELFELMVHPTVREGSEQTEFVELLNETLNNDGLKLVPTGEISGASLFSVWRPGTGASGRPKNIIFASNGLKPEIVLADAINNDIQIVKHSEHVLVYDRSITSAGLTWGDLLDWWKNHPVADPDNVERSLYKRLRSSLPEKSPPEKHFFKSYFSALGAEERRLRPALIPQVYLHFDPKTVRELLGEKRFPYQRMDFLLLLPKQVRVVIEIDGRQHYSDGSGKADTVRYAEMVRADRDLKLRGYEVYRFGGSELQNADTAKKVVQDFVSALLNRHGWQPGNK